ncbi:Hypothetical protein NTJ_00042 [Nesidiocoris tenuis]|uniref:Secreted protein n=1 Tax=Nesidiocoris tenuis TaxID=355587 RepID=A0ABN7A4Z6_9HEMI|nr:Hypothetical protein NTJ_00042 [Nesidiocoris tenuis]
MWLCFLVDVWSPAAVVRFGGPDRSPVAVSGVRSAADYRRRDAVLSPPLLRPFPLPSLRYLSPNSRQYVIGPQRNDAAARPPLAFCAGRAHPPPFTPIYPHSLSFTPICTKYSLRPDPPTVGMGAFLAGFLS